jgi:hypothetical protein
MTQENREIIRFGVMCKGRRFKQWQANAIKTLLENKQIECHLLIIDSRISADKTVQSSNVLRPFKTLFILLSDLFQSFMFFTGKKFQSNKQVDMVPIFTNTPEVACQIIKKGKFSEYFKDSDISEIKKYKLDFILRFGFGIIKGDIFNAAKYGVWSFHLDDEQKFRGTPPCFWEIYNNDKVTGAILQRLTDKLDGGIILRKGYLKTKYSYPENKDQVCSECYRWPAQVCADLLSGNAGYLNDEPSTTKAPIYHVPTNFQLIKFLFKSNLRKIHEIIRNHSFVDYWNIGVVSAPIHSFLEKDFYPPVKWFPKLPKKIFFADPFMLVDGNKLHIFFEEYPYKELKGKIAYICYENGQFSGPETVLDEPFHLSYPYILKIDGDIYMIPQNRTDKVMMYKAIDFPLKWEKRHVLIDNFPGVDSTPFNYEGVWWMFTSARNDGKNHNLKIYYADDIFGEWHAHPQNPIKTDVRSARSAGTPYVYEGVLYRPAMNYSEKPQGSITINKVLKITKEAYQEVKHNEVRPYKNSLFPDKIHTLCGNDEYTVIDGCKESFILTNINYFKYMLSLILKR